MALGTRVVALLGRLLRPLAGRTSDPASARPANDTAHADDVDEPWTWDQPWDVTDGIRWHGDDT